MKRYALLLSLALFASAALASAQNLILNPGFENGAIPTNNDQVSFATGWSRDCGRFGTSPTSLPGSPDLFDRRSPHCDYQIPSNKWGIRDTRAGGNRYVGFTGSGTPGAYAETVKGTLSAPLTIAGCNYQISFWASAIDGWKGGPAGEPTCTTPLTTKTPNPNNRIEVVLRKGNDCSNGKVIFQSPAVTQKQWTYFAGQFSLTPAEAAVGYDRIELRMTIVSADSTFSHAVYLDDVSLVAAGLPIDPDFQLTGWIPAGNANTFLVRADVANIPVGSGFWWNVEEIDPATGAVVPNTTMTNPPAWWSPPQSTTFSGYYNNNSPNGVFVQGHTYRIRRGTWSRCNPWSEITKTISMCTGANCL